MGVKKETLSYLLSGGRECFVNGEDGAKEDDMFYLEVVDEVGQLKVRGGGINPVICIIVGDGVSGCDGV